MRSLIMCANCSTKKFFLKGINLAPFVILQTTLSIALYLNPVTLSADSSKLVTKSIAMSSYSFVSTSISCNSLYSACVAYLFF